MTSDLIALQQQCKNYVNTFTEFARNGNAYRRFGF
jgi:hypothetical protein